MTLQVRLKPRLRELTSCDRKAVKEAVTEDGIDSNLSASSLGEGDDDGDDDDKSYRDNDNPHPLDGPTFQTAVLHRDFEIFPTAIVTHNTPAVDIGLQLRFEEYNGDLQTWQPTKQHVEDCMDPSLNYLSVSEPVERTDIDTNHLLFAGLQEEHSINAYYSDLSPYPAQIEYSSTVLGEQTPT